MLFVACLYSFAPFKLPKLETKTFMATVFFLSGYVLSKQEQKFFNRWAMVCFVPLLICSLFLSHTWSIDIQGGWIFPYYLLAIMGILGTFHCAFAMRGALAAFLDYVGKHTLQILTFHFLAFKLVSVIRIYVYDYDWDKLSQFPVIGENNAIFWVVYVIAGVGLPLLGIELSKKKR